MTNNVTYIDYPDREAWLNGRKGSLGASEVASSLGLGFITSLDLWKIKTGRKEADDLSQNKRVQYGTEAEAALRRLFELQHGEAYEMEHHPYRVYRNAKHPYITATLDGELTEKATGRKGVWECKTAWVMSKADFESWNEQVPTKYYIQVCSQMEARDCDFAILTAQLIFGDGHSEIRHYHFERGDSQVKADTAWILKESKVFWGHVEKNTRLPIALSV